MAPDAVCAYSEKGFQRIQVLVQGNEGFEGSAGIDGGGSDHGGQNLHVHDGAIKQWPKEWHLCEKEESSLLFHFIVNN